MSDKEKLINVILQIENKIYQIEKFIVELKGNKLLRTHTIYDSNCNTTFEERNKIEELYSVINKVIDDRDFMYRQLNIYKKYLEKINRIDWIDYNYQ